MSPYGQSRAHFFGPENCRWVKEGGGRRDIWRRRREKGCMVAPIHNFVVGGGGGDRRKGLVLEVGGELNEFL